MNAKMSLFAVLLLLTGGLAHNASSQATSPTVPPVHATAPAKPAAKQPVTQATEDGDDIWRQQCSRCHNAPAGFSPRIAGTVIRHMRVRASLSRHQEEQLLSFLNP